MDFSFSIREQQFRRDLHAFLEAQLPSTWSGRYNENQIDFATTLDVTRQMAEKGWLTMHWPAAYGGRDASVWEQVVLREEMRANKEPRGPQYMSVNYIGTSIMLFGTEEQKNEHLPRISNGRAFWCQGFSEPDSGSDLASLKTSARLDGDEYVINGEKIWTSHTPHAEWMILLARTDPHAPKHKGISVFLLDVKTPGVTIVPIRSLLGYGEFAHCYLDNARIPKTSLLGNENEGWRITIAALQYERLGAAQHELAYKYLKHLQEYALEHNDATGSPLWNEVTEQTFAEIVAEVEASRLMYYELVSDLVRGSDITLSSSISRVSDPLMWQRVADFGMEVLGEVADADLTPDPWRHPIERTAKQWMQSITATIAGGTTEVQRNIAATRGLGLPS